MAPHLSGSWEKIYADLSLSPEENKVRETDFDFEEMSIADLDKREMNLDAVFVAEGQRVEILPHCAEEFMPQEWAPGAISSKVRKQETGALRQEVQRAHAQISSLTSELAEAQAQLSSLRDRLHEQQAQSGKLRSLSDVLRRLRGQS